MITMHIITYYVILNMIAVVWQHACLWRNRSQEQTALQNDWLELNGTFSTI